MELNSTRGKVDDGGNSSLSDQFDEAQTLFQKLEHSSLPSNGDSFAGQLKENILQFKRIKEQIFRLSVFSPNDELEDVSTSSLR
jgi:immunoglobulin-binding protein 1